MSGNELNYKNNRSGIMVNGVGRSGNRALLYSMGLEEDDFRKPIIGIANSFSELVPGHIRIVNKKLEISCGKDSVIVDEIQFKGGKRMTVASYLNGHDIDENIILK